jgi:histone acetyltransferase (RNA polymerase elongator complex component)
MDIITSSQEKSVSSWSQNGSYHQLAGRKCVELVARWILSPAREKKVCRVGRKMDLITNSGEPSVSSWSQDEFYDQLAEKSVPSWSQDGSYDQLAGKKSI